MAKATSTKEKLLIAARDLFWTRGYSNVSVRDITKAAGVDAALVSRYFGGKSGLFEATLEGIPTWPALEADPAVLLDIAVETFSQPFDPATDQANPFSMLMANVIDPEMGDRVRDLFRASLADPLAEKFDEPDAQARAVMLLGALFGMALMRKSFQVGEVSLEETRAQIRHLAEAALGYEGEGCF